MDIDMSKIDLLNINSIDQRSKLSAQINLINNILSIWDIYPNVHKGKTYTDCPFCNKKNKLHIINGGKNVRCFSSKCPSKVNGDKFLDIIAIYRLRESKTFIQTINELNSLVFEKKGYIIDIEDQYYIRNKFLEKVLSIYKDCLWNDTSGKEALNYLYNRGLNKITIQRMELGFAPNFSILRYKGIDIKELSEQGLMGNRGKEYYQDSIIIPIRDYYGNLLHLQGRYIKDIPEDSNGEPLRLRYKSTKNYKNLPSISQSLFGEDKLNMYSVRYNSIVYITEGVFDALSLLEMGYPAVSMFGINSLKNQVHKLNKFKSIVIIGDNDKFEEDHILYPGQFKSWSRLNNQVYDLQISLPNIYISIWYPPEYINNKRVKDVNDYFTLDKESLKNSLEKDKKQLLDYWKEISLDNNINVESFIRLVSCINITEVKEKGKIFIKDYMNKKNIDPVDFILKAITDDL